MGLSQTSTSLIFENNKAKIIVSKHNSLVESIIDKKSGNEIKGNDTFFFSLIGQDKKTELVPSSLNLENDVITISSSLGEFKIKPEVNDDYFTFELISLLPEKAFKAIIAHAKYNYDYKNKDNTGAVGIALTYWANPCFYPDAKDLETKAEVVRHLQDTGAKYALIIAPIIEHRDIIKKASLTIDRNYGLISEIGGAWGRDSRLNFGNYVIQYKVSDETIKNTLDFLKDMGVDQVDFHKGSSATFRQGDFKYAHFKDNAEFKAHVSDVLEANGMSAGLHTYSFYIDYDCDTILSAPEYQKDFGVLETFTLAEDMDENTDFLATVESTANVSDNYGFMSRNTPFILIDEEMIKFVNAPDGFKVAERGAVGTKAVTHKKGAKIRHIDGYYHGVAPVPGSDLFLKIARDTAKTFNEGGFKMIYLDALDGIRKHCDEEHEAWYYCAEFICEILKHCDRYPLIEYSTIFPSIWPARGRIGAFDLPFRCYKAFNNIHSDSNKAFIDRFSAPTMGWYFFYPRTDRFPGNEHTKYQHTDAVEHMGALSVMYDYSIVFAGVEQYNSSAGLRRNTALYRKYDDLRKAKYFSEDILEKLRNGKWEYHIVEKENGDYVFVEKDYQIKKFFDLSDDERNNGCFSNPFDEQTPFIRIEAMMSTDNSDPMILLPLDPEKDLTKQQLSLDYGCEIDFSDKLAKKVSVCGNGKKGGAIGINLQCGTNSEKGYALYVIDTDFEGWRDFVLMEADNGERPELQLEENRGFYQIYRSGFNHERVTDIFVETVGDMTGVKMSDIVAVNHTYEILKNPTVKIGDSSVTFDCELMSTDFIEFDGETAKVIDRFGNEKTIFFSGNITAPTGGFKAELTTRPLNRTVARAQLTLGFTGKEIK